MNNRGVAGSELLVIYFNLEKQIAEKTKNSAFLFYFNIETAQSYCGAYTEDLRYVIDHVKKSVSPKSPLFAVGYSLGANILVKYIGEGKYS